MTVSSTSPTGGEEFGRREANKRATRNAIQAAADQLIAARGFEATTVREIADAAKVTERTFYRYFDGKEALVAGEATALMDQLHHAIVARPSQEPPLLAVKLAIIDLSHAISERSRAQLVWLFNEPVGTAERMRRAGVKPLVRFEQSIEDAVLRRMATATGDTGPDPLTAELIARVSVAVLRTVASQRRRARVQGTVGVSADALIERAFAALVAVTSTAVGQRTTEEM